jgi:hypothetical protein
MHAHSHSYPHPIDHDDTDDDEATLVCPSPFLAMLANEGRAASPADPEFGPMESGVVQAGQTKLAKGYPSAPVQHTFTEPLRGYPQSAAYVPRHEETYVGGHGDWEHVFQSPTGYAPTAAMAQTAADQIPITVELPPTTEMPAVQAAPQPPQPSLPATIGMPAVTHQHQPTAPAPSFGRTVVPLSSVAPEASQPLVIDSGSVAYAAADPQPALFAAPAPTPVPPTQAEPKQQLRGGRALFGALLGAIAGAVLWGAVGYLTGGYELKYGAILIGLFTGVGAARLGGGHSKGAGALGAVFGLAGILTGKALFEILVQPHLTLGQHIAYHTTPIDLVFYAATVVTGFAVGAGTLSPRTIFRRGRWVLRRFIPSIG